MSSVVNKKKYMSILLEIAKTQKQLLSYSMDWKRRLAIQPPRIERTGFLGLKKYVPSALYEKESLLEKLEGLKERARQAVADQGGYYWWDMPWEQVEQLLLYNLVEDDEIGEWRFEHKWEKVNIENSQCLIFHEEGHCSSFEGRYDLDFYETSKYSSVEKDAMMKKYNEKICQQELNAAIMLDGYMVHSQESGKTYASIDDYLLSAEYYFYKSYQKTSYKNSLSTEHQRNSVRVTSNSLHYHSIYFMAEYHISGPGCMLAWTLHPYTLLTATGDLPKELVESRQQMDAVVASAAFLSDQEEIGVIPCSLFEASGLEPFAEASDAIRYAEIFTCIAEKMYYDKE